MAFTETTNELHLFSLQRSSLECKVAAKIPLAGSISDRTVFDSVRLYGQLIVARNTEDASMHMFMSNRANQLSYFKTAGTPEPEIFKMPADCSGHVGDFWIEGSHLTVEACPGQILHIQSSLSQSFDDDGESWGAFFQKHFLKMSMTVGLLGTGIY